MASQIDPTKPTAGNALTSDVRANFQIAANEITALQQTVGTGTTNPNVNAIAALGTTGVIALTAPGVATTYPTTSLAVTLLAQTTTANMRSTIGCGTASTNATGDFLSSASPVPLSLLTNVVGANGTVGGTKGVVPAPLATDNVKFLKGDGSWAGVSGTLGGALAGNNQNVTTWNFADNPRYKFLDNGNSGTAITINVSAAQFQRVTLTGNATITLTGWPPSGTVYPLVLEIVQDATGNRVPTFAGATFKFSARTAPTFSTGASQKDIVSIYSVDGGTTAILSLCGVNFG